MRTKNPLHILIAIAVAGLAALVMTGPLSGLILDGYDFQANFKVPLILAGFAMFARLLFAVLPMERLRPHKTELPPKPATFKPWQAALGFFVVFALCASFPVWGSKYWITVLIMALIYVLLGLGLNIVVGLAGLLDLGFVGFYAVGAYGYALGFKYLDLGFWGALPTAALTAGLFGAVLGFPVLRMHGDYLAIVTLGFGEIIRLILNNWLDFTGGPNGLDAPPPTFLGWEFKEFANQGGTPFHEAFGFEYSKGLLDGFIYLTLLVAVALTLYGVHRLRRMPIGRAWEALREDEIACRSLGLNHVNIKLSAFMMGASIGGVAGVFFAAYQGFVSPVSFSFFESALVLAIVVLGGMGSLTGVVLSALFLTIMPELLREFSDYRILVFGIAMVLIMIVKPRGLVQLRRPFFAVKES
ncbi:MAG TPA: high-affinity branched-chain amino acid ABC transporter permease LivM [Oligoflexus sp.]|uniref:high-affinity branched-chain amino acid ABC transporter permease LivM n=1 Tax=Oligoflexus sp. TaxID=1971216 RepID=UPI002D2A1B02|nr:high-affinity branched-chain amino acid ABC transporter permease LivM [Oligoflexus sp.]HYX36452.1 high-affinity branched-chain amino acid ABC transporter permease LivM [Oligoflexus sp.]